MDVVKNRRMNESLLENPLDVKDTYDENNNE